MDEDDDEGRFFAIGNDAPRTPVQATLLLDFPAGLRRIRANMNACLSIRPKQKERTAAVRAESDHKAGLSAVQR
ncbi:MAG: hypothetical protein K9N49_08850 [Candidatus Marinimicrobia bacterium]|nr:hypothetical protein [Candidatus Neomarinimicrobiota bacterium]